MSGPRHRLKALFQPWLANRWRVDEEYYFANYPDVASAGMSAYEHYCNHGWREGRNPSADFHTLYYAQKYLGGGQLSENPLLHFSKVGNKRRIATTPQSRVEWELVQKQAVAYLFDKDFYRQKYGPHLSGLDPVDHYFEFGWKDGYDPSPTFNTRQYLLVFSFIARSDVNPFYHFVVARPELTDSFTVAESTEVETDLSDVARERLHILSTISSEFDSAFYLKENPDVASANVHALTHYVDYGWKEGRNPNPIFWTKYYLARYPEVQQARLNPFYHYVKTGRKQGLQPNPMGVALWERPRAPSEEQWSAVKSSLLVKHPQVSVVVPVYKGYDDSLAAIYSVLSNPQESKFELLVINDSSPDQQLTDALRRLAERNLFVYVENKENLGFVRTVNKALEMRPQSDIVLLNADALVYGNWLDRLLKHAKEDPSIATITPFSNNASICSYPNPNHSNVLALECSRDDIDRYAAICNEGKRTEVPTGVGFCFFMRRAAIDEIGDFDLAFGRGYGEENDFCMRALKAGYKNVFAHDVFVYHSGQVSFNEFHEEEYDPGQRALAARHPDYSARISAYVTADPAKEARARLDLYRLARHLGPHTAVMVTIETTGGIGTHIDILASRLEKAGISVVLLSVNGRNASIKVHAQERDIYRPALPILNIMARSGLIEDFLRWLNPTIIHVHSFALLQWGPTKLLMRMLQNWRNQYYVTLHDYDSICHRHHLVDREGRYCDPMDITVCRECVRSDTSAIDVVDPEERIKEYTHFLTGATSVFVPSEDTKLRLSTHFPNASIVVREHEEQLPERALLERCASKAKLRVGLIGAIGPHKGCDVLYSLALDAQLRSLPIEYIIVGYSANPQRMRSAQVIETGRYESAEHCIAQIEKLDLDFAFFPSIWPETYCYALSISLALGLPPIVFDIGAQAERIKREGFGVVFDVSLIKRPEMLNDKILALSPSEEWDKRRNVKFRSYSDFLSSYYGIK